MDEVAPFDGERANEELEPAYQSEGRLTQLSRWAYDAAATTWIVRGTNDCETKPRRPRNRPCRRRGGAASPRKSPASSPRRRRDPPRIARVLAPASPRPRFLLSLRPERDDRYAAIQLEARVHERDVLRIRHAEYLVSVLEWQDEGSVETFQIILEEYRIANDRTTLTADPHYARAQVPLEAARVNRELAGVVALDDDHALPSLGLELALGRSFRDVDHRAGLEAAVRQRGVAALHLG